MSPIAIGLLAITMSLDAFVAALGRGASMRSICLFTALRMGLVFGLVEAITPLIGWGLGVAASQYVQIFDHWIAFGLLVAVGLRMVLQGLSAPEADKAAPAKGWALLFTAIGTSIDAMAVGVSLAFLEVNILIIALAIGAATMTLGTIGALAGSLVGNRFGKLAEIAGGTFLMLMGAKILLEHLAFL